MNLKHCSLLMLVLACRAFSQTAHQDGRYVAMGSSYAAGPGVGRRDPAGIPCQRSSSNFAHLIAAQRHLELVDVSCSGATTSNILVRGQHGLPAQIEAVTRNTALVTILIGGNDVDYVGNLAGLSCRDAGGTGCRITDQEEVTRKLAELPRSLDQVAIEVRRRAPGARIVFVGYLPAVGPHVCSSVPLEAHDAERVRAVAGLLAQIIADAARRNHAGVVRSSMLGVGHDACSAEPYVTGAHPERTQDWPGR